MSAASDAMQEARESGASHFLLNVKLFRDLPQEVLVALEHLGHREVLPLGRILVARGPPAPLVYGVLQGTVACLGPEEEEIARLGPGATVPLLALTPLKLAEATWRAATPVEAFVVPRDALVALLNRSPEGAGFWRDALPGELAEHHLLVLHRAVEALGEARRQWQRRRRAELRAARGELLASLRAAALEELIVTAVHEAANPLAAALGFAQLLQGRGLSPEARRDATMVEREAQRVSEVLRRLRRWVPRRVTQRQRLLVPQLLGSVVEVQEEELRGRGLELEWRLSGDLSTLQADPHQLSQALLALLVGAGEVLAPPQGRCRLLLTATGAKDQVEVRVSCPGGGLPARGAEALLDPLSGPAAAPGVLELHLCQRIARDHGGDLRLEPLEGGGIALVLALPRVTTPP